MGVAGQGQGSLLSKGSNEAKCTEDGADGQWEGVAQHSLSASPR